MSLAHIADIMSLSQEDLTKVLKTMDNDHSYIHQGKYYTAAFKLTIGAGAVNKVTFLTPAATASVIHYRPAHFVSSVDKLTLKFYEGASENVGGSVVTPVNRNRNSLNSNGMVLKTGVTVGVMGTQISEAYIPGAVSVGGSRSGADLTGGVNEWVLKPETLYVIEYTNGSAAENIVFTEMQWYEEEA